MSQSLPIHIIPVHIIRILHNPDRNLGSTSVRITHYAELPVCAFLTHRNSLGMGRLDLQHFIIFENDFVIQR